MTKYDRGVCPQDFSDLADVEDGKKRSYQYGACDILLAYFIWGANFCQKQDSDPKILSVLLHVSTKLILIKFTAAPFRF
jgi:hypothetical protein